MDAGIIAAFSWGFHTIEHTEISRVHKAIGHPPPSGPSSAWAVLRRAHVSANHVDPDL